MSGALAAIDVQDLAGDERRGLEEHDALDDVLDVTHVADGMQSREELVGFLAGASVSG